MQDAERRADLLVSRKRAELQEMYASFRRGAHDVHGAQRSPLLCFAGGAPNPGWQAGQCSAACCGLPLQCRARGGACGQARSLDLVWFALLGPWCCSSRTDLMTPYMLNLQPMWWVSD